MHNSPRLVLFAIWTRTKVTEECVKELRTVAKSRGVVVFEYDTSRTIYGFNTLLSTYPSKLLPIFSAEVTEECVK